MLSADVCKMWEINQLIEILNRVIKYYTPYCFLMNNWNVKYVGTFQINMQKMTTYICKVKFKSLNSSNSLVIQICNK